VGYTLAGVIHKLQNFALASVILIKLEVVLVCIAGVYLQNNNYTVEPEREIYETNYQGLDLGFRHGCHEVNDIK